VLEACARLVDFLPARLDGAHARVVAPRSPLVHAWGAPPVVLRCGVARPTGYDPASASVATVNGVAWFEQVTAATVRWTAVRRDANVELVVPRHYAAQGGFLAELAAPLKRALP
jgi:hypothetical protein